MSCMLDNQIIVRRLATIKYLYRIGLQQSMQVDTVSGFSILSFHDCAEMFLLLVAENNGISTSNLKFMEYWRVCPNLTLKESMKSLKDRRVSIKHKGQFPSKSDIEISRITTTNFLEENTPIQFGFDFKDISISSLISFENVREYIDKAESFYNSNDLYQCVLNSKIAFIELLSTFESNKLTPYSFKSILNLGDEIGDDYKKLTSNNTQLGVRWFEQITKTTNKIREVLKITSLGIDYKKYTFFEVITPLVNKWWNNDKYEYNSLPKEYYGKDHELRGSDCRFCIDFVIDNALKLQEFDYNLTNAFKQN